MKIVIVILLLLFTISAVFSTSCVDQSTNNSMAVSIPQCVDQSTNNSMAVSTPQSVDQSINNSMAVPSPQLGAMHHCNDGAMAQTLSCPIETYDMRALFEYCFPNYQPHAVIVNDLGITVAAGFKNTDECLGSRVGSGDQSLDHVQISGDRRMAREAENRTPPPREGDFGRRAPIYHKTNSTGG